ncbi:sodium/hydrogen exchanger [Haloterrigena salina JCM 13891]|uniref:Sodium/hydrogen exchanger n=1 Tax=Haloterrigena salina JCM 13891 TaxID=1227488 RepID=M0CMJ3_9EURY|nr:cation:proton antiporter [Haloterrigena salina]ELZ24480.1 sodium/hydrogen exchanger [Haloterrigena salina JCM 13891]
MATVFEVLVRVCALFALALGVRVVVDAWLDVPYSVLLIVVGVVISVLRIDVGIRLSADVIVGLVLPPILFNGVIGLDRTALRENLAVPLVLVALGIPLAVALLGSIVEVAFGLSIGVSLLLAAILVPTDPVAVLSLFSELDAPEQLTVVVEGESLFNDGVAVVIVNVLLALLAEQSGPMSGFETAEIVVRDLFAVGLGGFLLGSGLGYGATRFVHRLPERMAVLLVTVLLAYGSYVVAESVGVSGILATVGAGAFVDLAVTNGTDRGTVEFVRDIWEGGAFLLSTIVYVLIGTQVPIDSLAKYLPAALLVTALVLLVRATVVYVLVGAVNLTVSRPFPRDYQHVLVWGGLHTVVPVALALGLPSWVPHREFVQAVVFGVAIVGALVQGTLLPYLLRATGLQHRVVGPDRQTARRDVERPDRR